MGVYFRVLMPDRSLSDGGDCSDACSYNWWRGVCDRVGSSHRWNYLGSRMSKNLVESTAINMTLALDRVILVRQFDNLMDNIRTISISQYIKSKSYLVYRMTSIHRGNRR